MRQKKNKGLFVTIIILLVVILLLLGIMAYLYFFTDIFKSNKQLFFQYTAQLVQSENGFIDNTVLQYLEKKKSTSYENSGDISFNVSIPSLENELELANNFNISFLGKIDANNAKSEREIYINYSDDVNFPFTYRKTNNITGIQTKYISSNFVAIKNDEELSGYENLNRLSELQNIEFSKEEIQSLKTTYFDNMLNNLDETKFSKLTEGELIGYKLTLSGEEFKNILVQILNSLKTDENTINKVNGILKALGRSSEIDIETIETTIQNINNDLEINNAVEFTVYEKENRLTRVDISIAGNTLTINKQANGQEQAYLITANVSNESGNASLSFSTKYTGLDSDSVNENYEIILEGIPSDSIVEKAQNLQNEIQVTNIIEEPEMNSTEENVNNDSQNKTIHYQYMITNTVQFKDSVEIEDLTDQNAVILNDKDDTYVSNLMTAMQERLVQVNQVQMEELGVSENENPIQYVLPTYLLFSEATTQVNEEAVNAFNQKFELYESTNTKGATVKGLLTTIQNNNETDGNNKIEEINMDGEEYEVTEQNITFLKSSINVEDAYRVEFEKDIDTGLIYRAVINKR